MEGRDRGAPCRLQLAWSGLSGEHRGEGGDGRTAREADLITGQNWQVRARDCVL